MPRFAARPKEICAVKFTPGFKDLEHGIVMKQGLFEKWYVWNVRSKQWLLVEPYDYIRYDIPDDHYPIAADYMADNYQPL